MTQEEAEFMGYLKGEGCFRMQIRTQRAIKLGWKDARLYCVYVSIAQRDDDGEILKWAKQRYGGSLVHCKGNRPEMTNQKPHYVWMLTSAKTISPLLDQFLESRLPSKKREQAELLKKVCDIKLNRVRKTKGYGYFTEEEKQFQEFAYNKLKELKKYKVQ